MQKFEKYDHVMIAENLGDAMSHFESNTDAVVMYSYNDKYGCGDTKNYCLYVNGRGEVSWYEEWQLSLLDKNGKELLTRWKREAKIKSDRESSLDWIFENGEDILKGASGASIEALALCLGVTNLWGSHGEGFVYYQNAIAILSMAKPFLEKKDKPGWLDYCQKKKSS